MRVLGVILARGGSTGLPRKNILELGNKPLVAWTIEAAKNAKTIDCLVASTDDDQIRYVFERYKLPVVMVDYVPPDRSRMVHLWQAITGFEKRVGERFDVIADLHADCPFKTAKEIDEAIRLLELADADSVIGVTDMGANHPARAKWIDESGYLRDFVPEPKDGNRQNLKPKAYIRAGGLYVYRRKSLSQATFGHKKSVGYVLPNEHGVNIDTGLDFLLAQAILERNK